MPRKRKRKYERKTTVYKRRKKSRKRRRIPKGLFAKTTKMAFRYVDTISISGDTGPNMAYHTFSCNGMYDPDVTSTGHQPRGFDQYMQFYNHYTVIGAKIKCTFVSNDTTNQGNCYVGVTQGAGSVPGITAINTVIEKKSFKVSTIMGTRPRIVSSRVNLSKALGQKVLQEDNNAGSASSNPAEQWYFHIMTGTNWVANVDPGNLRVLVEIDYIAVLHEPKDIAGS